MYYLIIGRDCPHLQQELVPALADRQDIRVILDRRYGQRRAARETVSKERRRRDRRRVASLLPTG